MELSKDLENLISAALVDKKITSKDKEILTKKAVAEGIDKDEFWLYLDSIVYSLKEDKSSSSESILGKVVYHRKAGFKDQIVHPGLTKVFDGGPVKYQKVPVNELKIRLWHVLFSGILILSLTLTGIYWPYALTVDEALNAYDFEAAREAAADEWCNNDWKTVGNPSGIRCPRTVEYVKIITQEVMYMTDNNQFGKAASSIQELNALEFFDSLYIRGKIKSNLNDTKDDLYLTLLIKGIHSKQLPEDKIKIYLSLMTDDDKKKKVKKLLK